ATGFCKDENGFAYGWSGTIYLEYNHMQWGGTSAYIGRWWYTGDNMYPVPPDLANDLTAPFDGGVRSPGAAVALKLELPATLDPPELGLVVNTRQEMISPDVSICGFVCDQGYDPNEPYFFGKDQTGFGLFAFYPTRYVHVTRRATVWRPVPHLLTTVIREHAIRFKRLPTLTEPVFVGWLETSQVGEMTKQGIPLRDETMWRRGDMLIGWMEGGVRPSIFLNDGVDLLICRDDEGRLALKIPVEALPTEWSVVSGQWSVNGLPPAAGTTIRIVGFGGTTRHTSDMDIIGDLRRSMGLDGAPAYPVTVTRGTIRSQRIALELDADDGVVAFTIPRTRLSCPLPVMVHGLSENRQAFLIDRRTKKWRPLGVLDGTAYAVLDTNAQAWDVAIGHPFMTVARGQGLGVSDGQPPAASHADLRLNLVPVGDNAWHLELHNPTDTPITATVTLSPCFDLFPWHPATLTLPPGHSLTRTIP
ncbi:MAG: hypothetical protein FWF84_03905, partial [Kiritimatiellaeota bacterium]|nr:hypothetical protein [Kiritimatiellota bacterium]